MSHPHICVALGMRPPFRSARNCMTAAESGQDTQPGFCPAHHLAAQALGSFKSPRAAGRWAWAWALLQLGGRSKPDLVWQEPAHSASDLCVHALSPVSSNPAPSQVCTHLCMRGGTDRVPPPSSPWHSAAMTFEQGRRQLGNICIKSLRILHTLDCNNSINVF